MYSTSKSGNGARTKLTSGSGRSASQEISRFARHEKGCQRVAQPGLPTDRIPSDFELGFGSVSGAMLVKSER